MFSLDNFDLEFDDDFSTNIFSKSIDTTEKKSIHSGKITDGNRLTDNCSKSRDCDIQSKKEISQNSNNFLELLFDKQSKENLPNLKRSSLQDEKPHKKRLSDQGLLQRRFPGPAGLLPDKPFKDIGEMMLIDKPSDEDETNKDNQIYSQSSGSVFSESQYQKLALDFSLNEADNPLNKYTVEWVKKTAVNKGLQGRKIPFLAVVLHCVNHNTPDPVLLLRDPTGEINGTLHREVWADLGGKLQAGIALALRQVGVFITGVIRRQIYLNITINNILAIYRRSEENEVETTTVNKLSKVELLRSLDRQPAPPPRPRSSNQPPTFLFTTVEELSPNKNIGNIRNKAKTAIGESKEMKVRPERVRGGGGKKTDEVLADLGILLTDGDFSEEMKVPLNNSTPCKSGGEVADPPKTSQILSQAENLIFEEVLSGINLDEFEM